MYVPVVPPFLIPVYPVAQTVRVVAPFAVPVIAS